MARRNRTTSLAVRDLRKRYGNVQAVNGVSFEIGEGEIFGLLGRNGAGKTTVVECVLGLREPDAGTIELCGLDGRRHPLAVKERIGAAPQASALHEHITPREALRLFGGFYREREDPGRLLERFSLGEKADEPFDSLSGGQRQRLALALAFVNRPELIFLDEPTSGLDAQSRRALHSDIAQLKSDGLTVLLTTHDLGEAEQLCDRIAVIDHGRIVVTGTPRELIARSGASPLVRVDTIRPVRSELVATLPHVVDVVCAGTEARIRTTDPRRTLSELMALLEEEDNDLTGLEVRRATLEEIFLQLTDGTAELTEQ